VVVSACGAFLGTKVDPSVRIIHLYEQTKWRIQLQAMLAQKVNGERLTPTVDGIYDPALLSSSRWNKAASAG